MITEELQTAQHRWLMQLVGDWTSEMEYQGPDGQPQKHTGKESVRSLGGIYTVAEGKGEMGCSGGEATSILTLGYDPKKEKFVGTFVASMMTHLWVYEGSLDSTGKILTLDTVGPDFTSSTMAKYQDILEFVSEDHRTMKSQVLGPDGKWIHFMTANYRRVK